MFFALQHSILYQIL